MTQAWHEAYVADKSGKRYFRTIASPMALAGVIRGLKRHIDLIKNVTPYGIDANSVVLMLDGEPYCDPETLTDAELLSELFS